MTPRALQNHFARSKNARHAIIHTCANALVVEKEVVCYVSEEFQGIAVFKADGLVRPVGGGNHQRPIEMFEQQMMYGRRRQHKSERIHSRRSLGGDGRVMLL